MPDITRRDAMLTVAAASVAAALPAATSAEDAPDKSAPVQVNWVDGAPPAATVGANWGVPWPRGTVAKETQFSLAGADSKPIPLQSWIMAYWPDGSLKWTGHAISALAGMAGPFTLTPGAAPNAPPAPLSVKDSAEDITITNGGTVIRIVKKGTRLIESITHAGKVVAQNGRLVLMTEDRSDPQVRRGRDITFTSQVDAVTLEQSGPVRAVVKLDGKYKADAGDRTWLPWSVRFYFFAGVDTIRVVHSFVFDGDQEKDYISGMGLRFTVPMREQVENRHVRLVGESTGLFAEPIRPIIGRSNPGAAYTQQLNGQALAPLNQLPGAQNIRQLAIWDQFKLTQMSADSFSIQKRTGSHSAWLSPWAGKRSLGLGFIGDTSGGLSAGLHNFWQLHPTGLEVTGASTNNAELTVWLWSPDAPSMDLRHYDIVEHGLIASYEDITPGFSTAYGVGRTHELMLCPAAAVPPSAELMKLAEVNATMPRIVCSPATYYAAKMFGPWSVQDKSKPARKAIEDGLDAAFDFFISEVENRHWYGFWDFGDIMRSFDRQRHVWEYDVGGFAWLNTELMPDLYFWYMFLRTGRADYLRFAENMTRHTQEVDSYHIGRFVGLGSRHNVRHWGDGAKESRICQSLLKRFHYYVTTDERTGDLMREVLDADQATVRTDPLRKLTTVGPAAPYPTHMRSSPDWTSVASNWLAEWERTNDTKYRDRIVAGMKSLADLPQGLRTGLDFAYDPKTYTLHQLSRSDRVAEFIFIFGGAEFMMEIATLIQLPEWDKAFLALCAGNAGGGMSSARAALYAAHLKDDQQTLQTIARGIRGFSTRNRGAHLTGPNVPTPIDDPAFADPPGTFQSGLTIIQQLELAGKYVG